MDTNTTPTETQTATAQPLPPHVRAINELLEIAMDLVRVVQKQAHIEVEAAARLNEPAPDFTFAFERMGRAARRTALLAEKFSQPAKPQPADRIVAARREIIRSVEDSIARDAPAEKAESLRAEFMDRIDCTEIEDEIGDRPVEAIVTEIRRDLGIAGPSGQRNWRRRTPKDLALLCARASTPRPTVGPFVLPMPPRTWTPMTPLFEAADTGAGRWPGGERIRGP